MGAASDELILSHLWLPRLIAQAASRRRPDLYDDLEQVGRIGMLAAGRLFEPERRVKFSTYSRYFIRGRAKDFLEKERRDEMIPLEFARILDPAYIDTPEEQILKAEASEKIAKILEIADLSPNQRTVITQYWLGGIEQRDIAEALGVTEGRVSQINKRALQKLRRSHMGNNVQGTKLW